MTHPITPPPELVQQWANESPMECSAESWAYELFIAHHAAQWGADQELEACIDWISVWHGLEHPELLIELLRAARRPKPPSLKVQALETLKYPKDLWSESEVDTIRRALEALPE
jgi:hypothetical protein